MTLAKVKPENRGGHYADQQAELAQMGFFTWSISHQVTFTKDLIS